MLFSACLLCLLNECVYSAMFINDEFVYSPFHYEAVIPVSVKLNFVFLKIVTRGKEV